MRYIALFLVIVCITSIGWVSDGGWNGGIVNSRQYSNILPAADNTYNIGSTANSWKNVYVDGSIYATAGTAGYALCVSADKRLGMCGAVTAASGACTCTAF